MKYNKIMDKLGIWLSGLCLIHCILLPILFVLFPLLGLKEFKLVENSELYVHSLFFVFIILIGIFSFYPAYKIHKRKKPFCLFLLGSSFLISTIIFHEYLEEIELYLNLVGSIILIYSHFKNKKHCKSCHH